MGPKLPGGFYSGLSKTFQINPERDPNDLQGPAGFGSGRFVTPDQTLPYTILFENEASAGASAQQVVITQQLDANLDLNTFQLGDFGFGNLTVNVPAGLQSYSTRLDLRSTLGVFVDVSAGLDRQTGVVTWTLTALDPATLDIPADALLGFLPPNKTSPEGEGFVNYSVRPKAGTPTGIPINAQASIVFGANAAIPTPQFTNIIDAGPPTSSVAALPATEYLANFPVSWAGQDDAGGSGVNHYDVYVSTDGGPFALWMGNTTQTSAAYPGQDGHSYGFYSVATDNVGYVQATPAAAQASTLVHLPPVVTAASYYYDRLPNSLSFTFSKDVSKTLSLSSIQVRNATTGAVVPPQSFSYDAASNTATFTLAAAPLPDGSYTATLLASGIADAGGVRLDGSAKGQPGTDYSFAFFVLTGDVDHDGKVGFADLVTLARHYGQSNATYSQGDVNYDGMVDFKDLTLLARHYGQTVASQPAAASADLLSLLKRRHARRHG